MAGRAMACKWMQVLVLAGTDWELYEIHAISPLDPGDPRSQAYSSGISHCQLGKSWDISAHGNGHESWDIDPALSKTPHLNARALWAVSGSQTNFEGQSIFGQIHFLVRSFFGYNLFLNEAKSRCYLIFSLSGRSTCNQRWTTLSRWPVTRCTLSELLCIATNLNL